MAQDWQALTQLTGGSHVEIERVRLQECDIAIEGHFELPPLARLDAEDQVFVAAFVRCHGSIKQMEKSFGVSYPTIKNRLNRIGAELPFMDVEQTVETGPSVSELLTRLEQGELTVSEVLANLKGGAKKEGQK